MKKLKDELEEKSKKETEKDNQLEQEAIKIENLTRELKLYQDKCEQSKKVIDNLQHYIDDSLESQQNQKQVQASKIKDAEEIQTEFKRMKT